MITLRWRSERLISETLYSSSALPSVWQDAVATAASSLGDHIAVSNAHLSASGSVLTHVTHMCTHKPTYACSPLRQTLLIASSAHSQTPTKNLTKILSSHRNCQLEAHCVCRTPCASLGTRRASRKECRNRPQHVCSKTPRGYRWRSGRKKDRLLGRADCAKPMRRRRVEADKRRVHRISRYGGQTTVQHPVGCPNPRAD